MFKSTNTIQSEVVANYRVNIPLSLQAFSSYSVSQCCRRSSLLARKCALQSRVPHSESFGHLVDVEHMVSRKLLTNVRGDMVCVDVTSLIVPKPF